MLKKILALLCIATTTCSCFTVQSNYLPGFDFENFQSTPVYNLAKASEREDTLSMIAYIQKSPSNIDYPDPHFGQTLLALTLMNNKSIASNELLKLGANPNARCVRDNSSPFLDVCNYPYLISDAPRTILVLINYGADVNSMRIGIKGKFPSKTALQFLCESGTVDCVKLLINHDASLTIYPKSGYGSILFDALSNPRLDVLKYLLIDKNLPVPDYLVIRQQGTKYEKKVTLAEILEERPPSTEPHDEAIKKEILTFLKANKQG
jgi:hypothetical protein